MAMTIANRRWSSTGPLTYCTYMGGSGADQITALNLDSKGRLYITGSTTTGEMPYIDGAYDNFNAGTTDIFLAIINTATADGSFAAGVFQLPGRVERRYSSGDRRGFERRGLYRRKHQFHGFSDRR